MQSCVKLVRLRLYFLPQFNMKVNSKAGNNKKPVLRVLSFKKLFLAAIRTRPFYIQKYFENPMRARTNLPREDPVHKLFSLSHS